MDALRRPGLNQGYAPSVKLCRWIVTYPSLGPAGQRHAPGQHCDHFPFPRSQAVVRSGHPAEPVAAHGDDTAVVADEDIAEADCYAADADG